MIIYRELQIKNPPGYFFSNMTTVTKLDASLLGVNQIFMSNGAANHEIEYFKDFDNADSLHLVFNNVHAYFKPVNEDKYLVFAQADKNKEMLDKYEELLDATGEEIRLIKGIEPFKYEKSYMNIPVCVIIVGSVFKEKVSKFYLQIYLNSCCLEHDHDANS